jgi:hypothetical protein
MNVHEPERLLLLEQALEDARQELISDRPAASASCRCPPTSCALAIHPEQSVGYADVVPEPERLERTDIATRVLFPASLEGSGGRYILCTVLTLAMQSRDKSKPWQEQPESSSARG